MVHCKPHPRNRKRHSSICDPRIRVLRSSILCVQAKALTRMKDWDNLLQLSADRKNGAGAGVLLSMMKDNGAPNPIIARCCIHSCISCARDLLGHVEIDELANHAFFRVDKKGLRGIFEAHACLA